MAAYFKAKATFDRTNPVTLKPEKGTVREGIMWALSAEDLEWRFEAQCKTNEPTMDVGTLKVTVSGPFETFKEAANA